MNIFTILAVISALTSLGCFIVILIDAFDDEIWKGLLGLLFNLYLLYYAIFEFEHEKKWAVVITWILSAIGTGVFMYLSALQA